MNVVAPIGSIVEPSEPVYNLFLNPLYPTILMGFHLKKPRYA